MKENIRKKLLKEEVVDEITLNDLLDLGSKAQIAVMQLSDKCMRYNHESLRIRAANVNKEIAELCNQIRGAIIDSQKTEDSKTTIEQPRSSENMVESILKKKKKNIKKLLEMLLEDEDEEVEEETSPEEVKPESKKIDLSSSFSNVISGLNDEQFGSFKTEVVNSLKATGIVDGKYLEIVNEIESTETIDEFNYSLDSLYDYADGNNIEIVTEIESIETETKHENE